MRAVRGLRAISPVWASEASRARTRERQSFRVSSPVPLTRLLFTISPNGEFAHRLSCLVLSKQKHAPERQNTWLKSITMTLLPCILVLL